jgi:hypothetical protein
MPVDAPSREETAAAMRTVFTRCRDEKHKRLFTALVPILRTLPGYSTSPEMLDREMDELCGLLNDLVPVVSHIAELAEKGVVHDAARLNTRLKVMVYCHIIEADYPYLIILNLLRVLLDRECCFTFYQRTDDDEIRLRDNGDPKYCDYPLQKVTELERVDRTLGTGVGSLLSRLLQPDLRNAFSHSQYVLDHDGSFLATKWFSGITGHTTADVGKHTVFFTAADIQSIYDSSLAYVETFVACYKEMIAPYKDGQFHQTELTGSPLRWCRERNQWTWHSPA